jgi:hypothetical protein
MWSIVIAIMLATGSPQMPVLMTSFSTARECVLELIEVSQLPNFSRVTNPFFGYAAVKVEPAKTTVVFCVKNIESV